MKRPSRPSPSAGHPIQVAVRRTGLSADVIRAWERRYGVVTPTRSETGRRAYSDADIERLRLIAQATLTGRTVAQLATLSSKELTALAREDADRPAAPDAATPAPTALAHLRACLDALARFDAAGLHAALGRATVALSAEAFLDAVVVRLWERVAEGVHHGTLRASHQHLAQAVLRRVLDRVTETATLAGAGPDLVVATPVGQSHELGALMAAAAAAAEGWRVIYLGPGLPAEDIAEATAQARARAVTVSLGAAPTDRLVARELRRLRTLLPNDVALVVEGTGADAHRGVLREIGASVLRDVPTLLTTLRTLRGTSDEPAPPLRESRATRASVPRASTPRARTRAPRRDAR